MKFKIGDQVKVICEVDDDGGDLPNYNLIGIIQEINEDEYPINVYFKEYDNNDSIHDNGTWNYLEDELEKISPTSDEILTWIREQNVSVYYNDLSNRIGYDKEMVYLSDMPHILELYHSWRQN